MSVVVNQVKSDLVRRIKANQTILLKIELCKICKIANRFR
jgi:hypothetical protein